MAIFGKKKDETKPGEATPEPGDKPAAEKPTGLHIAPDKAKVFFDRARTIHESTNYPYAIQLWLRGLRLDPGNLEALEGFFLSIASFLGSGGKKLEREVTTAATEGRGELPAFLSAILEWGLKPTDPSLAVRATEAAAKLSNPPSPDMGETTHWIGERAMGAVAREKKPRKDHYVRLMKSLGKVGAYDLAVESGERAAQQDPSDGGLAVDVRNMAAQMTMSRGGFEQSGQAGGFRANIRDEQKQRQLERADRVVKTEEDLDELIRVAAEDLRARPDDVHAINVYAKRLIERGRPEDEQAAYGVLIKAYEKSKQFRFRQLAGEIRLRRARRRLGEIKSRAEASPDEAALREKYESATKEVAKLEAEELRLCVENYPTDLGFKYELGRLSFEQRDFEQAIALLQESQGDARRRVPSLILLGRSFEAIGWLDEAIATFRQAIDAHRIPDDDTGMDLRYGLMTALQGKAEESRDLAAAEEAEKIAASIAIQQISFRDIRQRRDALKKLLADLRAVQR